MIFDYIINFIRKVWTRLRGYNDWVSIKLYPMNFEMKITNLVLTHGKCYKCGTSKDNTVPNSIIECTIIEKGYNFTICSCGRDFAFFGTQGRFDMYDNGTSVLIGTCLWASTYNNGSYFKLLNKEAIYSHPAYTFKITKQPFIGHSPLGYAEVQITKQT